MTHFTNQSHLYIFLFMFHAKRNKFYTLDNRCLSIRKRSSVTTVVEYPTSKFNRNILVLQAKNRFAKYLLIHLDINGRYVYEQMIFKKREFIIYTGVAEPMT